MTTGIYGRYIHLFDYVTNFSLEMSLLVVKFARLTNITKYAPNKNLQSNSISLLTMIYDLSVKLFQPYHNNGTHTIIIHKYINTIFD